MALCSGVTLLPGARIYWVVLPLLSLAHEKHDGSEREHNPTPGQIQIYAERLLVDCGISMRENAKDCHDSTDDQEDQAERDADIETHTSLQSSKLPMLDHNSSATLGKDEVKNDCNSQHNQAHHRRLLIP